MFLRPYRLRRRSRRAYQLANLSPERGANNLRSAAVSHAFRRGVLNICTFSRELYALMRRRRGDKSLPENTGANAPERRHQAPQPFRHKVLSESKKIAARALISRRSLLGKPRNACSRRRCSSLRCAAQQPVPEARVRCRSAACRYFPVRFRVNLTPSALRHLPVSGSMVNTRPSSCRAFGRSASCAEGVRRRICRSLRPARCR